MAKKSVVYSVYHRSQLDSNVWLHVCDFPSLLHAANYVSLRNNISGFKSHKFIASKFGGNHG